MPGSEDAPFDFSDEDQILAIGYSLLAIGPWLLPIRLAAAILSGL